MNRLDGKVAFLSGAARGIGGATAALMAKAGAKVAIGDVLDEQGRKTAKEIDALYVHLDVTSEASWTEAMDATVKKYGKLDVLVNNAGVFNGKGVEDATLEEWNKLVAVNLTGVVLGTRAALPHLKKSGATSAHGAAIVNLASIAGLVGSQLDPLYSLTIRPQGLQDPRQFHPSRRDRYRHGPADFRDARQGARHERHRSHAQDLAWHASNRPAGPCR